MILLILSYIHLEYFVVQKQTTKESIAGRIATVIKAHAHGVEKMDFAVEWVGGTEVMAVPEPSGAIANMSVLDQV